MPNKIQGSNIKAGATSLFAVWFSGFELCLTFII